MTGVRRRWRDLPGRDRRAALVMALLVPAFHGLVAVFGYPRTRALLDRLCPRPEPSVAPAAPDGRWELAASRVRAYSPLPGNCLSRSMALYLMLRRDGQPAIIQFGVSLDGAAFAAHAWITVHGRTINESPDMTTRYTPLTPAGRDDAPAPHTPPAISTGRSDR